MVGIAELHVLAHFDASLGHYALGRLTGNHCDDGRQDVGEWGVDVGGNCPGAPAAAVVWVEAATVAEGGRGTTAARFRVALSGPQTRSVKVAFTTTDGTAVAPADYAAARGTVTFRPGETEKWIEVRVTGDRLVEPDETFSLYLVRAERATIAVAAAQGTIENDD